MRSAERRERRARALGLIHPLTGGARGDCLSTQVGDERFTDLIGGPNAAPAMLRPYTFEVVEGPDRGRSVRSDRGSIVVGTSSDADLVLTDTAVSRSHVRLTPFSDGVEIADLGSKNGVFLAGARLEKAKVAPGTEFTIGRSTIRIRPDDRDPLLEPSERTQFGLLHGRSRTMRQLFSALEAAAKTDSPAVIEGERGTGKMRVARSLHELSARAKLPLVVFDGRVIEGTAWIEEALEALGTVVLRNVDQLPRASQLALLEALDARREPARLVTTSRRDLQQLSAAGQFERALLLELAIIHVRVPPLRERASDLPLLIADILQELGCSNLDLGPADLGRMQAYAWPDNVTELKTMIQRAISLDGAAMADASPEPPRASTDAVVGADLPYKQARAHMIEAFEREYVRGLLERHEGNISKAARVAGIDRVYLHRLLRKYEL